MNRVRIIVLLFIAMSYCLSSTAQIPSGGTILQIETTDGNKFSGQLVQEDDEKIVLLVQDIGEISLLKRNIRYRSVIEPDRIKDGRIWFENAQSTRYFWSPNGYGLKKGEGYYHNIWVLWNQFAYGVTDNFSIGGGIIPLFLIEGTATPVFLTPKFSIPAVENKVNIGIGALLGTIVGASDTGFGIVYGTSTFGSPDQNISMGLGYGFAGTEWASSPLLNLGIMLRISPTWYFISENYHIGFDGESGGMISGGARWIIKRAALDFGLFIPVGTDTGTFIALPWLGFTVPFGKAK